MGNSGSITNALNLPHLSTSTTSIDMYKSRSESSFSLNSENEKSNDSALEYVIKNWNHNIPSISIKQLTTQRKQFWENRILVKYENTDQYIWKILFKYANTNKEKERDKVLFDNNLSPLDAEYGQIDYVYTTDKDDIKYVIPMWVIYSPTNLIDNDAF